MDDLRIQRLRARYRLSAAQASAKPRLDGIMRTMAGDVLADALAALGIGAHEEVCIDRLVHRGKLDLDAPDDAIAIAWADSITRALRDRLEHGGSGVVRFRSLEHALADLAISAARGPLSRAWAWKQLGLWRGPLPASGDRAAAKKELVHALKTRPRSIVPVLIAAAKAGVSRPLAAMFAPEDARALALALVASRGSTIAALLALEPPESFAPAAWAARLSRSLIFRTAAVELFLRAAQKSADAEQAELFLLAAIFEVEPEASKRHGAEVAVLLREPKMLEWIVSLAKNLRRPPTPSTPAVTPARTPPRSKEAPDAPTSRASSDPPPPSPSSDPPEAAAAAEQAEEPPIELLESGFTRAGGLLFLHHLIRELDLAEAIARDEAFAPRTLKGAMHLLALALLPLEPNDPAALAFAGFGPESGVAVLADPPPSRAEAERLEVYAAMIVERLRDRLAALFPDRDTPRDRLLSAVCRRRARIAADPAWIEVHLDLEEVSTELRRAGLDLDLGWVPWIGASVRFIYA